MKGIPLRWRLYSATGQLRARLDSCFDAAGLIYRAGERVQYEGTVVWREGVEEWNVAGGDTAARHAAAKLMTARAKQHLQRQVQRREAGILRRNKPAHDRIKARRAELSAAP